MPKVSTAPDTNANKNADGTDASNATESDDDETEEGEEGARKYSRLPKYVEDPAVREAQFFKDGKILDDDGKLVGKLISWPTNLNPETHRIAKADVADELIFQNYKAEKIEARARELMETAKDIRELMSELQQIGDLETRSLVSEQHKLTKKMAKIADQIAAAKAKAAQG